MMGLVQCTNPPGSSQRTAAPAEKRPTPVFWIMRKASAGLDASTIASMIAAPSVRRAVAWIFMTSPVPVPGRIGPGERLAVTGELTHLRQHVVQGETLLAPRRLADA